MDKKDIFLLYYSEHDDRNVSVFGYENMLKLLSTDDSIQNKIADFVGERLKKRFIKPFMFKNCSYQKDYKNGFAMMACGCLLIETIECFYRGKQKTPRNKSEKYFNSFFERAKEADNELGVFKDTNFYTNVRCGILHQGETQGGYRISRKGNLYSGKSINATCFLNALDNYISYYVDELKRLPKGEVWENMIRKMNFVVLHAEETCQSTDFDKVCA